MQLMVKPLEILKQKLLKMSMILIQLEKIL